MKKADSTIYLDELRPKKNGTCSVKIRITHNRKRKYFPTGIDLEPKEFEQIMTGKRRTPEQKEIYSKLNYFLTKAEKVIKDLIVFTFDSFEEAFLEQRNIQNSVSFAFEKHIKQLQIEKRLGTAISYQYALKSIDSFKPNLSFAEINKSFLDKYESFMLQNGKSKTTIGIYLRSLRAIYNQQNIDRSIYPFGDNKKQYSIPTGRNIKKALTVQEIARIFQYEAKPKSTKEMAKDYWIFLYLSNGMNVKDFCMLKWENIEDDMLTYIREKTKRSNKESKPISVALKTETKEIIQKWGLPSLDKKAYIFPHLQKGMTAEAEMATYKQLTKTINKHMKQIANELNLNKEVTTYFARHSFATVLKRSGANIAMISDLLGHSSVGVTESYLDGFEKEQIQAQTDVLTIGFQKAN
jgi:integrase